MSPEPLRRSCCLLCPDPAPAARQTTRSAKGVSVLGSSSACLSGSPPWAQAQSCSPEMMGVALSSRACLARPRSRPPGSRAFPSGGAGRAPAAAGGPRGQALLRGWRGGAGQHRSGLSGGAAVPGGGQCAASPSEPRSPLRPMPPATPVPGTTERRPRRPELPHRGACQAPRPQEQMQAGPGRAPWPPGAQPALEAEARLAGTFTAARFRDCSFSPKLRSPSLPAPCARPSSPSEGILPAS